MAVALEIRARYLWDGDEGCTGSVTVRVEGDRIRLVETTAQAVPGEPADILDLGDATILPGLVDMHTHLGINHQTGDMRAQMKSPPGRHVAAGMQSLCTDLASGVTTAKLNGDREFFDIQARDAIRDGVARGPRLLVSGRGIKSSRCTGGVVATCIVDDLEAIGRCVDENLAACADWIKLFSSGSILGALADVLQPFYGLAQLSAAASKAHAAGKRMSSHCFGGEAADACIAVGVDVIDHGWLLSDWQLEAMVKRGTWLCPTLGVLTHPEGALTHVPPGPARDDARRRLDEVCGVVRKSLQRGVPLLAGTDAMHGGLAYELATLQDLGGRPAILLRAATGNAARALGLSGEIGTVRAGAAADIVAVRGNALEDVRCLADVLLVVQAGRIVRQCPAPSAECQARSAAS
jgi:imidazolonepropionase-like amidohydrolase